jgi:hypothetical protein
MIKAVRDASLLSGDSAGASVEFPHSAGLRFFSTSFPRRVRPKRDLETTRESVTPL